MSGFEVREFTIWRVVCHYPGCPWSQRHDDPETARRDGVAHVAEWHRDDDLRGDGPVNDVDLAALSEEEADELLAAIRGQQRTYSDLLCLGDLVASSMVDTIRQRMGVLQRLDAAVLARSWAAAREREAGR